MFDVTYIPAEQYMGLEYSSEGGSRQIQKFIRRYFPRNYEDLISKYEFILLRTTSGWALFNWEYFTPQQMGRMRRGIEEGGLGALQDLSVMTVTARWEGEKWAKISLSDAFPNDADAVVAEEVWVRRGMGRIVINSTSAPARTLRHQL